jgi:hypothetical protein
MQVHSSKSSVQPVSNIPRSHARYATPGRSTQPSWPQNLSQTVSDVQLRSVPRLGMPGSGAGSHVGGRTRAREGDARHECHSACFAEQRNDRAAARLMAALPAPDTHSLNSENLRHLALASGAKDVTTAGPPPQDLPRILLPTPPYACQERKFRDLLPPLHEEWSAPTRHCRQKFRECLPPPGLLRSS